MFVQLAEIVLPKDYEVNEARPETRSAQLKHVCVPLSDHRLPDDNVHIGPSKQHDLGSVK